MNKSSNKSGTFTGNIGYTFYSLKKSGILEDLTCGVCGLGVRHAVQVPCGCRFCQACISSQIYDDSGNGKCPTCSEEFNKKDLAPDHHARRQIQTAIIFCPNKHHGCPETLPVKDLPEHTDSCMYSHVVCLHHSKSCKTKLMRKDLMEHLKTKCEYRLIECTHCKTSVTKSDFQTHEQSCLKLPVECPNDCGTEGIKREDIEMHLDEECPRQEKICKYQEYGCQFKGVLEKLEKHMEDDVKKHLDMVTMAMAMLDLKFSESLRHISELKSQRTIDDSKEKELLERIHLISQTMKVKDERFSSLQRLFGTHLDKFMKLEAKLTTAADRTDITELRQVLQPLQESTRMLTQKVHDMEQNKYQVGGTIAATRPTTSAQVQMANFERELNVQAVKQSDHDLRFQLLETASYDGVLLWKIAGISRRRQEAISGKVVSLYSQPFYTSRYGYKMCGRMYLNGDGMGKGTHVSLFFVVMKGDYDALLQWPFNQKVTMMLLDQETGKRSLTDSFKPDGRSSSFKRPTGDMNIASGCPLFVSQHVLHDTAYVKDDTMFIKIVVDTSDLFM